MLEYTAIIYQVLWIKYHESLNLAYWIYNYKEVG